MFYRHIQHALYNNKLQKGK